MDNPFNSPAILSLCPGFLGLERGLQRAIGKINVAAYVEIEAFIIENILKGMEAGALDAAPVWTDIKTFDAKPFCNKIHGIIGGYPCQPFSLAGKRKGEEDPRHLWPFIRNIIRTAKPVWCWFENVSGHLSMGYDVVYKDLRDLGYAVEAGIFTAEEAGAPHERERLFILAISEQFISYTRRKRIRWETWANINWSGEGTEVGNPNTSGSGLGLRNDRKWQKENEGRKRQPQPELSKTSELANTNSESGQPASTTGLEMDGFVLSKTGRNENTNGSESFGETVENTNYRRCQQCNPGIGIIRRFNEGYSELANTKSTRCRELSGAVAIPEKFTSAECDCKIAFSKSKNPSFGGWGGYWPAKPGQQQYDWEEPRTIESRMGCTANGYNFREDILRGLGNMVVEQQGEIGFITLLKKHLNNLKY